jgi:hypothetical protein
VWLRVFVCVVVVAFAFAFDSCMMAAEEYRLTLVSNSELSQAFYPGNTTASFTIRMCRELELASGIEYEMALTKIQIPISFNNVNDTEFFLDAFRVDDDGVQSDFESAILPRGNYPDVHQLLHYLNSLSLVSENLRFDYNEDSNRVDVAMKPGARKEVQLSPKLRAMLGFRVGRTEDWITHGLAPNPVNMYRNVHRQIFVYCDLVEPQLVGDSMERILHTVGIPDVSKYGHLFIQSYDNPDYIPLLKTHFDTIKIDMRTYEDQPVPFEFGPSLVKVHIRRRQRRQHSAGTIVLSAKRRRW